MGLVATHQTDELAARALAHRRCEPFGIAIARKVTSGTLAHELLGIDVAHDDRGAPYAAGTDSPLISLTDEGDLVACAWATPQEGSRVLGVGIDLADPSDFDRENARERIVRLMFFDEERALAKGAGLDDRPLTWARLFSAKEAAFKATSQALRAYYRTNDEELFFEVRDFSSTSWDEVHGVARVGDAAYGAARLDIQTIKVYATEVEGLALTCAIALGKGEL